MDVFCTETIVLYLALVGFVCKWRNNIVRLHTPSGQKLEHQSSSCAVAVYVCRGVKPDEN